MSKIKFSVLISFIILGFNSLNAQTKIVQVDEFDEVTVSPHIQVTFIKGEKEEVQIESISVSEDKLNIEVKGNTLNIYLDDAKMTTKSEKVKKGDYAMKQSIYHGTIVKATVIYKNLNELSLRGEQAFVCKSLFEQDELELDIYGECNVFLKEVKLDHLKVAIYGESNLTINSGSTFSQKYVCYGESDVNTKNVSSEETKVTAYGEATVQVKVAAELKVTSYGEATIKYIGNPSISKGIIIGETDIVKIR